MAKKQRKNTQRLAFSKTRLEALPPPDAGRVYHFDTGAAGLALCVTEAGRKTFYFYKWINGRPRRVRIGGFPELTVENARGIAKQHAGAVAGGADPQLAKRRKREEPTLADLWSHWQAHSIGRKRPRSIAEDARNWKNHLSPWAGRKLSSITNRDVAALHSKIGQDRPFAANRVVALLRAMFNKAEGIGWKGDNPGSGIDSFPEKSRDRFMLPEELPRFFQALREEPNPILQGFFMLSLLCGARKENTLTMRWSDISFELRQWRIPETKRGIPQVVPLSAVAIEVLESPPFIRFR